VAAAQDSYDYVYDHVVVGAGSAGCVLAARLTEDPSVRVLLLEAGGADDSDAVHIPMALSQTWRTHLDWGYRTQEQKHAQGRRLYWPRGKVLGGSSSINAMIYIRGARADYDEWAALGNEGWSYDDVLPYFLRSEDNSRGPSAYHGTGGPLAVSDLRSPHPWSRALVESAVAAGHRDNPDFNGESQDGAGLYQVTQRRGKRCSTAVAYLHPAMSRPNLTVLTHALTTRVVVQAGRAVGVEYRRGGATSTVRVSGEVLLAGGSVNSPQLLLLSGIGPAAHLRDVGVDVVHALPGVGQGLQDHPCVSVVFRTTREDSLSKALRPSARDLWDFYARRRGHLTSNGAEAGIFARSRADLDVVDLQHHIAPLKFWEHGLTDPDIHALTMLDVLVRVASKGSVSLRSADPTWSPAIDAGYLAEDEDLEALVAGIRQLRAVAGTGPLTGVIAEEVYPGPAAQSADALRDAVRGAVETLYHPVSSCRMGTDDMAVVDSALRVHGLAGLRVVDASVMPTLVRGNTNAPTIMIAERAADMLRGRTAGRPLTAVR